MAVWVRVVYDLQFIRVIIFLSLSYSGICRGGGRKTIHYGSLWAVEDAVHLSSHHLLCVSSQWAYSQLLAALHTAIVGH